LVNDSTPPLLELRNVSRSFLGEKVLDSLSFRIQKGEILGLLGRSGAGKSTLIRCINGLERIDSGDILFEGKNLSLVRDEEYRLIQRRIGMIFQYFNLLSSQRIIDNVALPLKLAGENKITRRKRAYELLDLVGLSDKANSYPGQLSGGQQQRVAIARALAYNPSVLLSDEATSALDSETTQSILELLVNLNRQMHLTIVLITHEVEVVRLVATRLIVVDRGKIVEEGSIKDIFIGPQSVVTRSLLQIFVPRLPKIIAEKINCFYGKDAIFEFYISGKEASQPFLNNLEAETGVVARILQGRFEFIQNEPIGLFFLAIEANQKKMDMAYAWLKCHGDKSELVGYV
jgi:D-methionine transport system ATP-binding protein